MKRSGTLALLLAVAALEARAGSPEIDRRPGGPRRIGAGAPVTAPQPLTGGIGAPFTKSIVPLCDGGAPASNGLSIFGTGGYAGTPQVTFTSVPAGIVINPPVLVPAPMPPDQTIPFTVAASGAGAGPQTVVAHVTDAGNGIDVTTSFVVNVTVPSLQPSASPAALSLSAGGAPASLAVALQPPFDCLTVPVTVTLTGLPAGVTASPASVTLASPGYGPASFTLQAASSAPSASATVTAQFTASGFPVHTAAVALTVAGTAPAPDFTLAAAPAALSIAAGGSANVTVSAAGANGFSGTVDVTAQPGAGLSATPATFALAAGASQTVQVRVATGTPPGGPVPLTFRGTATGIASPRDASVQVTVTNAPDFALQVTPLAVRLEAGGSAPMSALLTPLFGFGGSALLDVSGPATLTPARPTLSPGAATSFRLTVPAGTAPGTYALVFRATESGGALERSASATLEVLPSQARFSVSVSPSAFVLSPGTPVAVTYTLANLTDAPLAIASATLSTLTRDGAPLATREEPVGLAIPPRGRVAYAAVVQAGAAEFGASGTPPLLVFTRLFRSAPDAGGAVATAAASASAAPGSSLVAPLSITRVSLVAPISGTVVGRGDALRAQGLLLGTGSGPVVVGWFWDGLLVETSTVLLRNGTPVTVATGSGLPTLLEGTHELSLAVLSPNPISSPRVAVVVEAEAQALRLVSPPAGSFFLPGLAAPTFSWIPLPGVARYAVGLKRAGEPERARRWLDAGAADRLGLSARAFAELPEGEWEWVVRGESGVDEKALASLAGAAPLPATAPPDGWTAASRPGRFVVGELPASPVDLGGLAESAAGGVRLSWNGVPNARHLLLLYDAAGARVDGALVREPSATLAPGRAARAARWRAVALDPEGRPIAWTEKRPLTAGGAR